MKKLIVFALLLVLLSSCYNENNPQTHVIFDTNDTIEERNFNLSPTSPDGWCVKPNKYDNIYGGFPDVPKAGMLKLTDLAAYLANTAEINEEMYFLVGVTDKKENQNTISRGWNVEDFLNYYYNGNTVQTYLSELDYYKYCEDTNKSLTYASWDILHYNLNNGMSTEEALDDESYRIISDMYFEYQKVYFNLLSRFLCEKYTKESILEAAQYLEDFGIELVCDPSAEEWCYHLQVIKTADTMITAINGTIDFLVKCTKEELWKLYDGNTEYGYIFYASDSQGRYIISNSPPAKDYRGNVTTDLCYYDRRLIEGHVAFSYEELNIYDRLRYEE